MNIIVLASACRTSGALTIYKQFLSHLPKSIEGNRYFIFVDPSMDQPEIENVEYIQDSDHSYKHRMFMDKKGYMDEMLSRDIIPDVVFSLQNTGCVTRCKQVIYYHQPLPFYPQKWNPFKRSERLMFLYKYIYPFFVKRTLNNNTDIVVQIPFIKKGFAKRFNFDSGKIHVAFPDVENIDVDNIPIHDYENDCNNFIYPATAPSYKGHLTIAKAIKIIKDNNESLANKIKVHLTIEPQANIEMYNYITKNNLLNSFEFHGSMPHDELLSFYKGSIGLLFPSTIETLGLPLLEAATFGLPIIASDLDYAHEVTTGYKGVEFVPPRDYALWAKKIINICENGQMYVPMKGKASEWGQIFERILDLDKK